MQSTSGHSKEFYSYLPCTSLLFEVMLRGRCIVSWDASLWCPATHIWRSKLPDVKNSSALSRNVVGNLWCNMNVWEVSEDGRLCLKAHSSRVFVPRLSLWTFVLLAFVLLPETLPFPKGTLVLLRFGFNRMSAWGFLASWASWVPSHRSLDSELSCGEISELAATTPCLHDLSRESSISTLSSCNTRPRFWSQP